MTGRETIMRGEKRWNNAEQGLLNKEGEKVTRVLVDGKDFLVTIPKYQRKIYLQMRLTKCRCMISKATRLSSRALKMVIMKKQLT